MLSEKRYLDWKQLPVSRDRVEREVSSTALIRQTFEPFHAIRTTEMLYFLTARPGRLYCTGEIFTVSY